MRGSSGEDEIILHDLSGIVLGQVREYSVGGEWQSLPQRAVTYALPAMREVGEWSSALHLQNPAESSGQVALTLYDGWGNADFFASREKTIDPRSTLPITLAGELSLPSGFWGVATAEGRDGQVVPLGLIAASADGRRMATEGMAQGAPTLYVPYLPNGELLGVLYALNAGDEPATVRVTCYEADGSLVPSATVTLTVAPRATIRSTLRSNLPPGFQGSAIVESLDGSPLVGAVSWGTFPAAPPSTACPSPPPPPSSSRRRSKGPTAWIPSCRCRTPPPFPPASPSATTTKRATPWRRPPPA